MILAILQHTPPWVFAVFAGLVYLGIRRFRPTDTPVGRMPILPLAMAAFSLFGVVQAFGPDARNLAAWAVAYAGVLGIAAVMPARRDVQYSSTTRSVRVPGSVLPLALMMTIFFLRYAVAVSLAMHPAWRGEVSFATPVSALYGFTSAWLAGRALVAWRSVSVTVGRAAIAEAA